MPSRLLFEGGRINSNRNPRGETSAQYWTVLNTSGVAVTIVGTGSEDGIPYVDWQVSGTATSDGFVRIAFDVPTQITATTGSIWSATLYASLVAGAFPSGAVSHQINEFTAAGALVDEGSTSIKTMVIGSLRQQPWFFVKTLAGATTARVSQAFKASMTNGEVVSFTVRLGAPQLEAGPFTSSIILPAVGTPGASTRANEAWNAPWSYIRGTIIWKGVLNQASPTGTNQTLFQIDDGSDANRLSVYAPGAGTTLVAFGISSNVNIGSFTLGSYTPGVEFTVEFRHSISGFDATLDGGARQTVTATQPSGLTTLRIGRRPGGGSPMFGYVTSINALPFRTGFGS